MDALSTFAAWLNQWAWLNLLSLLLGIIGVVLAIVFYVKGRRQKLPVYQIRTVNLVQDNVSKIAAVKILYLDQPIANLSWTRIAIWNRGNEPVDKADIAPKDQLRIEFAEGTTLLAAEIESVTCNANNFRIIPHVSEGRIDIDFDYFHTSEGLLLKVYHTGKSSKDVLVRGTVKGTGNVIRFRNDGVVSNATIIRLLNWLPRPKKDTFWLWKLFFTVPFILLIFVLIPLIFPIFMADSAAAYFQRAPKPFAIE